MLDSLLKLFELLKGLLREKSENDRKLHDKFVLPLLEQFERVHESCVSSLQTYKQLVNSEAPEFSEDNPVFTQLELDEVFSQASRVRLEAMSHFIRDQVKGRKLHSGIKQFVGIMSFYVGSISKLGNRNQNQSGQTLVGSLRGIAAGGSLSPALEAENQVLLKMWEMEGLSALLHQHYQRAKLELLTGQKAAPGLPGQS